MPVSEFSGCLFVAEFPSCLFGAELSDNFFVEEFSDNLTAAEVFKPTSVSAVCPVFTALTMEAVFSD